MPQIPQDLSYFKQRAELSPGEEAEFRKWYLDWAWRTQIDPDPDNPQHKYDYRAAWKAGVEPEYNPADKQYHWDSRFKDWDHPNLFAEGINTRTGYPAEMPGEFPWRQDTVSDGWKPASTKAFGETALAMASGIPRFIAQTGLTLGGVALPVSPTFGNFATSRERAIEATEPIQYKPKSKEGQALTETVSTPFRILYELKDKLRDALYPDPALMKGRAFFDTAFDTLLLLAPKARGGLRAWAEHARKTRPTGGLPMGPAGAIDLTKNPTTGAWEFKPQDVATVAKIIEFNTPAEVKTTVRPILDELVKRAETAAKATPSPVPVPEGGTMVPPNKGLSLERAASEALVETGMKNQGMGIPPVIPPVGPGIAPPEQETVHKAFKPVEQSLNKMFSDAVEDGDLSPLEYNRALAYSRQHPQATFSEIVDYVKLIGATNLAEPPGKIAPWGNISEVPVDTAGVVPGESGGYPFEMVEQPVGGGIVPEQTAVLPKIYKKPTLTQQDELQLAGLIGMGMPYSEALQRIMDAKKGPLGGGTPPPVPVVPPTGPPSGPPPAPAQASQQPQPPVQYEMTTAGPQPVYQASPSKTYTNTSGLGRNPEKDADVFNKHLLPTQTKVKPEQLRHLYTMIEEGQIPGVLLNPAVEYIKDDPKITRSQLIQKLRDDYDFDSLLAGEGWPVGEPVKPASHYLPEVVEQKVTAPTYGTAKMDVEVAGLKPREGETIGGLSTDYLKNLLNNFLAEELEVYDEVSSVQNLGNGKIVIHTNNLTPSAYGELRKAITNGRLVIGPPTPEPKKLDFSYFDQHGIEQNIAEGMGRQVSQMIRDLKAVDEWQKSRPDAKPLTMSQLEDLIGPVDQPLYKYVTDRYIETGNIKRRSGLPDAEVGRYETGGDKPQLYVKSHFKADSTFREGGGIYITFPASARVGTLAMDKAIKDILGSVNVRPVVTRVGKSKFKVTVDKKDTSNMTQEDLEELRESYMRDVEMAFRNEGYTVPGVETIQKITSQDIVPEPNELPIKESPQSLVKRSKTGHSELVLVDARALWRDILEGVPPDLKNDPYFDLNQDPANPKGLDSEGEGWDIRPPEPDDTYPTIDVFSGRNDILAGLPSKDWQRPEIFMELRKAVVEGKKIRIAVRPEQAETAAERWSKPLEPKEPRKMPAIQHRAFPPQVQWHGSRTQKFGKGFPDSGRHLGVHVGTYDQASNHSFIGWRINPTDPETWGAVHKIALNMRNPLELPDLGSWDPNRVVEELRKLRRGGGLPDITEADITELEQSLSDVTVSDMPKYSQKFYVDVQQRKPIVQFLRKHGYDGIIYLNRTEGTLPREQRVAAILFDPENQAFVKEAYKVARQTESLPTTPETQKSKLVVEPGKPSAVILHGRARVRGNLYPTETFMGEFGKTPTIAQKKNIVQRGYMTDDAALDAFLHRQRMPIRLMADKVSRPWAGQPTPGVNEEKPRTYSQKYLGTMPSLERRARLKKLYGAKPMDEFGRRLEALGGDPELIAKWTNTSWGQLVTRSVDMHEELLDIIGGKPQWGATKSKLPGPMKSRLIPLVQKHGKEALWKYLDETGIIGGASKPVMAVPSSFINCRPSAQCVNTCFASTGTSKMSNVLAKGITIEMAVQEDPVRAGDMMYDQYKNSPLGKSENHALRFFDRGEGSDNWATAIKRFNERGGRAQVFSKVPSFLNQVDPKNVRLLSIDTTNASVAEGNDLPIALNYEGRKSLALLNKYKDRIQVILPMVGGETKRIKSIVPPGEVELLTGWARPYVCPVDMAAVRAENPAISDKERAALKEKAGRWNCPMCDKGMGVGCFHKNTTDKTNFKK